MKKILPILLLISLSARSQEIPKDVNTIIVTNVSFQKVVKSLADSGYLTASIDSNTHTIKTGFKNCKFADGSASNINLSLTIKVKDGNAYITGNWYNQMYLSKGLFKSKPTPGSNYVFPVQYTWGADKMAFEQMNNFTQCLSGTKSYEKL